jgi:hypothetical protein
MLFMILFNHYQSDRLHHDQNEHFQDPRRSLFILIEEFVAFNDKIKKVGGLWGTKLDFNIGSLYFILRCCRILYAYVVHDFETFL